MKFAKPFSRNSVKNVGSADRYNINDLINKASIYDPRLKEYDIILVNISLSLWIFENQATHTECYSLNFFVAICFF